jgi:hypothetical protein
MRLMRVRARRETVVRAEKSKASAGRFTEEVGSAGSVVGSLHASAVRRAVRFERRGVTVDPADAGIRS